MNLSDLRITALLFFLGICLTFIYFFTSDVFLSVISYVHPETSFKSNYQIKLIKGSIIKGEVKAKENYFGIVSILFNNAIDSNDIIIFRIKEKNASKWYYENKYKAHYFYTEPFFPFGFPIINDSKNKIYTFEIVSQNGTQRNGISIGYEKPILVSRYHVPRSLLTDIKFLPKFIAAKSQYSLSLPITSRYLCLYFLPLILFLIWRFLALNYLPQSFKTFINLEIKKLFFNLSTLIFTIIFIDVSLVPKPNYFIITLVFLIWIVIINKYKYQSKNTLYVAFALLISCPVLFLFQLNIVAQKAAVWTYIFLWIGLIHAAIELKKKYV